jgi:competence protein ComEC
MAEMTGAARKTSVAAGPPIPTIKDRLATTVAVLRGWAAAEEARLGLWAPVALGAGAATYLLLKVEPPFLLAPIMLVAAIFAAMKFDRARAVLTAAALFIVGFLVADLRAASVDAPILAREARFADVEGRIVSIDEAPRQRRLVIDVRRIEGLAPEATPERVRVSWRGKEFSARPGDLVSLRANLSPPPAPAAPGGFDFARQLYFRSIGAVGYAVSPPQPIAEEHRPFAATARAAIESMRVNLSRRIIAAAPGDEGAIVAAVVTGKRAAISEEAEAAFRDSGLAHLLSISGLHMGLATGLIFFAVRAILALIEPVALTQPIKKWAAGGALVSGFAYLLISGGDWPATRAFIMSSIIFIAVIADRRALSLRNVAIAAFVIILLSPEAVLHPGFQMSFAAVTALIAWYEWASAHANPARSFSASARFRRYVGGVAVTDLIASSATAPFALYHFNRSANLGLAANVVSVPIMGFWVMPASIVALVLMPFGADGIVWRAAALGIDLILRMGEWTMNLPGAVAVFPSWPPSALAAATIGGLWLCLMSKPWRLAGFFAAPVAIAFIAATPHPALYFSEEGDNAGLVVEAEGKALAVADRRKGRFDARVWMEEAGINAEREKPRPLADFAQCDAFGCVVTVDAGPIAVSVDRAGLDDDCARAALVLALYPASRSERRNCAARLIDRRDAWEKGAHAVYVDDGDIRIVTSADRRGARPWSKR